MDLFNNGIGRLYGKKSTSREELIKYLIASLKNGELMVGLEESETGENLFFYDVNSKDVFSKEKFIDEIKKGKYPNYSVKVINKKETPVSKKDRFNFNNLD